MLLQLVPLNFTTAMAAVCVAAAFEAADHTATSGTTDTYTAIYGTVACVTFATASTA